MGWMDGWTDGRMDGWDGPEKCPLNFFIFFGYIDDVYVYLYTKKTCHQYSFGFQNFMSSWGSWSKISKLQVDDFSFFGSKSSLLVSKVPFNYVYTFRVHR